MWNISSTVRNGLIFIAWVAAVTCTAGAQLSPSTIIQRLGYPANSRLLIIHSDDLGMSRSVNRATFEALEKGWINSASMMVPCPGFGEAAEFARKHPEMDLGLHLTLTSEWKSYRWGAVSPMAVPSLLDKNGYLPPRVGAVAAHAEAADVNRELRAQIEKARAAGVNFTHLDSHMGALFQTPELYGIYQQVAHDYRVPNLMATAGSPRGRHSLELAVDTLVLSKDLQMRPLRSRKKWLKTYENMLASLKPNGVYQLILHLGYDDEELESISSHKHWGARWRQSDFDLVSNPEFQQFLRDQKFILVTWKELARVMMPLPGKEVTQSPGFSASEAAALAD